MQSAEDNFSCDVSKLPTSTELQQTVSAIRCLQEKGMSIDDVREAHPDFCRKYPKLVDKVMEPDMNNEQLSYIMSMFESVQQRNITFEDASKTIGKAMFDKFVAPDLSPEQLERVQRKMQDLQTHSPEELAQAAAQLGQNTHSTSTHTSTTETIRSNTNTPSGGNKKSLRKQREKKDQM